MVIGRSYGCGNVRIGDEPVMRSVQIARKALIYAVCTICIITILFLLSAWIGSAIPRNGDWVEPDADVPGAVEIMVETNGIHTAIVMPLVTAQKDWRADFPASDLPASAAPYTHISVSWGEREVFLNTPRWTDISLPTIIGAATGGDGLLHIAQYVRPAESEYHRKLTISATEYAALVAQIEQQILPPDQRPPLTGYSSYDVFYDAPGSYHVGNTCNQWTSDTLAAAGIKTGWWTPMAGGVMKWVTKPEAKPKPLDKP